MFSGDGLDRELLLDAVPGGKAHVNRATKVFPLFNDRAGKAFGVIRRYQEPMLEVVDESLVAGDRRGNNAESPAPLPPAGRYSFPPRAKAERKGRRFGERRPTFDAWPGSSIACAGPSVKPSVPAQAFESGPFRSFAEQDQLSRRESAPYTRPGLDQCI